MVKKLTDVKMICVDLPRVCFPFLLQPLLFYHLHRQLAVVSDLKAFFAFVQCDLGTLCKEKSVELVTYNGHKIATIDDKNWCFLNCV